MTVDQKISQNDPPKEKIKFILELFNSNKLDDAKIEIDKELITYSKSPILFNILGAIFVGQNKLQEALENYNESIKINPNYIQAYNNLGACMFKLGRIDEAIQSYEKAIEIQPNHADAHNNLGTAFKELKDYKKSIYYYEKTIQINPNSPIAYSNLGNAYKGLEEYKKAISWQQKAIKIDSKYADAHYNLGTVYEKLDEFEKAISCYSKAIEIEPNHRSANTNLLFNTCWSNKNNEYLKIAKRYYETLPKNDEKKFTKSKTSTQKIIKVGFVSGDFRDHAVVYFLLDTFKYLRKKEIKLFGYSNNLKEDNFTKLIKQYFDNWKLIIHKTDKELINLIRKDELDILFDLSGHTANNRLAIFKSRCAPVQATWCGWLASTGIEEIDYIIGDKYATPLLDQKRFTEKIYQLKKVWECSSISNIDYKVPFIKNNDKENVIFGSLVNTMKINESVINVWSKILNQIPNSKLFLKCSSFDTQEIKEKMIKKFSENKVNKNQLIIEGKSPRPEFMGRHNNIDIVLDTFPASAGSTSFDAAYMGVPILTKINEDSFWFRTGESINKNLNMNDWIAKDENDYIQKAIRFSENKNYLANLKIDLRNLALKSSLFDAKSYSDNFYEMLLNIK